MNDFKTKAYKEDLKKRYKQIEDLRYVESANKNEKIAIIKIKVSSKSLYMKIKYESEEYLNYSIQRNILYYNYNLNNINKIKDKRKFILRLLLANLSYYYNLNIGETDVTYTMKERILDTESLEDFMDKIGNNNYIQMYERTYKYLNETYQVEYEQEEHICEEYTAWGDD